MKYQLTAAEESYCNSVECAGFHAVKYHTFAAVEDMLADGVQGDLAEAGVLFGAHPAIMLYVLKKHGIRDRRVHLFDSFLGIPHATPEDGPQEREVYGLKDKVMESTGVSASSIDNVMNNLGKWGVWDKELVVFHSGWFEETLAEEVKTIDKLALLRVDCDLYAATKEVFKHLYPKVVAGGYVIEDDFGSEACKRAVREVTGSLPQTAPVEGQTTTQWWRKQRGFTATAAGQSLYTPGTTPILPDIPRPVVTKPSFALPFEKK